MFSQLDPSSSMDLLQEEKQTPTIRKLREKLLKINGVFDDISFYIDRLNYCKQKYFVAIKKEDYEEMNCLWEEIDKIIRIILKKKHRFAKIETKKGHIKLQLASLYLDKGKEKESNDFKKQGEEHLRIGKELFS